MAESRLYGLTDGQVRGALTAARAACASLSAFVAALVSEAARRELPHADGYGSTASWLRNEQRLSRSEAASTIKLGEAMAARPAIEAAVASGTVSGEQALVIGEALTSLAPRVAASVVAAAETRLLADATVFGPPELRTLAERVLAHVAPEIAEEELCRRLDEAERRAYAGRGLTMSVDRTTQQTRLSGRLTAEMGAILIAALEPLACRHPRPATVDDEGATTPGATAERDDSHPFDDRTPSQRRADALIELCRLASTPSTAIPSPASPAAAMPTTDMPATDMPATAEPSTPADPAVVLSNPKANVDAATSETLLTAAEAGALHIGAPAAIGKRPVARPQFQASITISFDVLRQTLGIGQLDSGQFVTPDSARRMACDAQIVPAVLGGAGQVLDLGRAQRTWVGPARRAIILRDRGCVFPACDRSPEHCDVHHIRHWSQGGTTDVDNGALLCGFHHHLIHHAAWTLRMGDDRRPEVIPPIHVDPMQRPLRNRYHLRL